MRRWNAAGLAVVALLGSNPAAAQNGLRLTSPLDVTIGQDSGFLARDQRLTDNILVVRPPQLSFISKSRRATFDASYQPEFELFENNRDLNAFNHTASGSFTYRITERLRFNAGNEATVTQDAMGAMSEALMFLPRHSFKQNKAHVATNYALTRRDSLTLSFDNVVATVFQGADASESSGGVRSAGTASLKHLFGRKHSVAATYSLLNAYAQFVGASYDTQVLQNVALHLSTGVLKDRVTNYLVSLQVAKRLGAFRFNGGYDRLLSTFGTSIPGNAPIGNDLVLPDGAGRASIFQVFSAGVSGNAKNRAGFEIGAAASRNNSMISPRDNNVSGHVKLDYSINKRTKIYADAQAYKQSFNPFVGSRIDRRRYMAGIQFNVSPQPDRVSGVLSTPNHFRSDPRQE